jgi:hypothetical protein
VTLLTSLLPWARTGRRSRTGVDLVRVSRTLHLATHGPSHVLLIAVEVTPLLLAAGWIAWAAKGNVVARIAAAATGAIAIAAGVAIFTSSLPASFGPGVALVIGAATLVLAVRH